jgi:hypothetical protein
VKDVIKLYWLWFIQKVMSLECFQTKLICVEFSDMSETVIIPAHNDEDKDTRLVASIRKTYFSVADYDGDVATMSAYIHIHYLCYGKSVHYWMNRFLYYKQTRYVMLEFDRDMGVGKWHGDGVSQIKVKILKKETPYQTVNRFLHTSILHHRNLIFLSHNSKLTFI